MIKIQTFMIHESWIYDSKVVTRIQRGRSEIFSNIFPIVFQILTCDSRSHDLLRHYSNSNGTLQSIYGEKTSVHWFLNWNYSNLTTKHLMCFNSKMTERQESIIFGPFNTMEVEDFTLYNWIRFQTNQNDQKYHRTT